MAEQLSTPRITASYLDSFIDRHVLIVGKVTQLRGDQATLDSDGQVTVLLNRDAHLANGNIAQVIGKVNGDLSIKALNTKDLGSNVGHGPRPQHPPHAPNIAMVWSNANKDDTLHSQEHHETPSPRRHSRRLSTSTIYTNTTSATMTTSDRTRTHRRQESHSRSRSPTPQQAQVFLPYAPSDFTQATTSSHRASRSYISPADQSLGTHISQTDHSSSSASRLLPTTQSSHSHSYISPEPSQDQEEDPDSISSAQIVTPIYTPVTLSQDLSPPSPLPSPPDSQPDVPSSPETRQRAPQRPQGRAPTTRRNVSGPSRTARPPPQSRAILPSDHEAEQDRLFNSVLDGIGRMYVSMNQDEAGRWRIKRSGNGYD